MQNRLFGVLDYLGDLTKQGIDFAGQQVPLIAHDIIMYGAVSGWIYTGIGLLLMGIAIGCLVAIFRKTVFWYGGESGHDYENQYKTFVCAVVGIISMIAGSITFGHNIDGAIKATFAPRVYLIEWVADQVKQLR